jgi:hypothetical protein
MKKVLRPKLTFFLTGLKYWALNGALVAMTCFKPTGLLSAVSGNKEFATEIYTAWILLILKTGIIWALAGGILGIVISQMFISRPHYEHADVIFTPPELAGPAGMSGPKTLAEINTGFRAWVLGVVLGVCGVVFVLPLMQNEYCIVGSLPIRLLIGSINSLLMTVLILPSALSILRRKQFALDSEN